MFAEPDEVIARIEEDVRRAQRYESLVAATATVSVRVESTRQDVALEVDHTGLVVDMVIKQEALSRGGVGLANEIVALCSRAKIEVQQRLMKAAGEVLSGDDPMVDQLQSEVDALVEREHDRLAERDHAKRGGIVWR